MLADELDYVAGVDTHRGQHALAVVDAHTGAVIAQTTDVRQRTWLPGCAVRFAERYAPGDRLWAIEGTGGHYGAGLARHLQRRGEQVHKVDRTIRGERRPQRKNDQFDAVRAARASLARERRAMPRSGEHQEALRLLVAGQANGGRVAQGRARATIPQRPWRSSPSSAAKPGTPPKDPAARSAVRKPQAPDDTAHRST